MKAPRICSLEKITYKLFFEVFGLSELCTEIGFMEDIADSIEERFGEGNKFYGSTAFFRSCLPFAKVGEGGDVLVLDVEENADDPPVYYVEFSMTGPERIHPSLSGFFQQLERFRYFLGHGCSLDVYFDPVHGLEAPEKVSEIIDRYLFPFESAEEGE